MNHVIGIVIKTTHDTNGNSRSGVLVHLLSGRSLFIRDDGTGPRTVFEAEFADSPSMTPELMDETFTVAPAEFRRLCKLPGSRVEMHARDVEQEAKLTALAARALE